MSFVWECEKVMFSSFSRRSAVMLAAICLTLPAFAQSPTRTRIVATSPSPAGAPMIMTAEVDALGGGAPTGAVYFDDGVAGVGFAYLSVRGAGQATLSAGQLHTCALTSPGGVKCWGDNSYGQLGDGTQTSRTTPDWVAGLTTGVVAVAAGATHSCAVTEAGAVQCWGDNTKWQIGDGTNVSRPTPAPVVSLSSGVVAVAVGEEHSCALSSDGGVRCWGLNKWGQLGSGWSFYNIRDDDHIGYTPSELAGPPNIYIALAAGNSHNCAVTRDGAVNCWGSNFHGQLGNGTTSRYYPLVVPVSGLQSGVVAVTAGADHNCAVTSTGALKCWGSNSSGQLGDGTYTDRFVPVQVSGLESGVVAAAAGAGHTCALLINGEARCWGDNINGALGDGTRTDRATPAPVANIGGSAVALTSGGGHSCAVSSPSRVLQCWGNDLYGQLGDGTSAPQRVVPVAAAGFSGILRARARRTNTFPAGWILLRAAYSGDASHSASLSVTGQEFQ